MGRMSRLNSTSLATNCRAVQPTPRMRSQTRLIGRVQLALGSIPHNLPGRGREFDRELSRQFRLRCNHNIAAALLPLGRLILPEDLRAHAIGRQRSGNHELLCLWAVQQERIDTVVFTGEANVDAVRSLVSRTNPRPAVEKTLAVHRQPLAHL